MNIKEETAAAAGEEKKAPPTVDILGFAIANLDMTEAAAAAAALVDAPGSRRIVTANAEILYAAHQSPALAPLLRTADLIVPDGIGVVKAAARLGRPVKERVAGIDLLWRLTEWAAANDRGIYLLGAQPAAVAGAAAVLLKKWPGLRLVGWHDGYFDAEEKERLLRGIAAVRPDILFVAMGFPAQDRFFTDHQERLPVGLTVGVGGSFDVVGGRIRRAPAPVRRLNLEWAWRFAQNPRRLGRFWALPRFLLAVERQRRREKHLGQ
ncbi:MAG: WecB/TagA/CpsF family glycosyltransferase [Peptococcaceae bacterium]|jgi:N-acetylglucosaminyldiphosphoundecaprenol N-acetyl-beta-D-mannosaminyltransferase|nr:WecB/TagA/CpsF family glycosyltransferase [Peptococcaceae bacterium]